MILYHGSTETIEPPKILDQQRLLDFGKGFYLTSSVEQAERWALIKMRRTEGIAKAIVNCYNTSDDLIHNLRLKIKIFNAATEEWLDFILFNRSNNTPHGYDIVTGPVANDTLYRTLTLFETGILTKPETIVRLKVHQLYDQFSFHTTDALACLNFAKTYQVSQ